MLTEDGRPDGEALQPDGGRPGQGFHVYRMAPGQHAVPHEHPGDEEFLLLEGDLRDHDGTLCRPGDLVWLRDGTRHSSHSEGGCLLAVYLRDARSL